MKHAAVTLVAIAALAGCAHRQVSVATTPATPLPAITPLPKPLEVCRRITSYAVDTEFDEREVAAIDRGVHAWEVATGKRECFLPTTWWSARLAFIRLGRRSDFYIRFDLKGWEMTVGLWSEANSAIYIVHEAGHTDGELGSLMTHEVGHFLSLGHYDGKEPSVMRPWLADQAPIIDGGALPNVDLRAYCNLHPGCDK